MKIDLDLKNCFGIEEMKGIIKINKSNAAIIYSKNGTMKTSLSKTFKKIQNEKMDEIRDEIFNTPGSVDIKIDDQPISPEQVFVIESFEEKYESKKLLNLLVNDEIRTITQTLLDKKDLLIKNLAFKSRVAKRELEKILLKDFSTDGVPLKSLIKDLNKLPKHTNFSLSLKYNDIFNKILEGKILSTAFQRDINSYIDARQRIYEKYNFLQMDSFDLTNFRDFTVAIKKSKYFSPNNKIELNSEGLVGGDEEFDEIIKKIDSEFKETESYQKLEKELMSSKQSRALLDIIQQNPEIIEKLKKDNISQFKRDLWASYLKEYKDLTEDIEDIFESVREDLAKEKKKESEWQRTLVKFNDRFTVPFSMEIANTEEVFLGEETPQIIFKFTKGGKTVKIDRSELETKNILSQGERRALYLLNILFDIESLKEERENNPILLIVDDIADSFDYQNKYAIIEYLSDLCKEEKYNFKLLILSHNFDFYRTVSSRLGIPKKQKLHTNKIDNAIKLVIDKYRYTPIEIWKGIENDSQLIALMPLARNLSEYKKDTEPFKKTYDNLTSILHIKPNSKQNNLCDLKDLIGQCIDINENSLLKYNREKPVKDFIIETANSICKNKESDRLEHKITLAIATRLKVEEYIICALEKSLPNKYSNKNDVLEGIKHNQTVKLIEKYRKELPNSQEKIDNLKKFSRVNIITPEHIHLNSFMYEPILDTDIDKLKNIYNEVSNLAKK